MTTEFDLVVIGAGSAAREAAGRARTYGASVAVVERGLWGGSCPNVACSPTKAYVAAADLLHDVNSLAAEMGIEVGRATANLARVRARKDSLKRTQDRWIESLEEQEISTFTGEASIVGPNTVDVSGHELAAELILVADASPT